MRVAEAPSAIKTTENPKTKNIDVRPAFLIRRPWPAPWRRSSRDTPERNEMYPGTSGSTHGDKKERMPAIKAIPSDT